jgi:hypothetical protein
MCLNERQAALEKAKTIRNPSQGAAGLFRVVLRIDGKSLVILAGKTRLLKCLDISEKVYVSGAVWTKLVRIQILCNQLAELRFR